MREISLTNSVDTVKVSDIDYPEFSRHGWYKNKDGYAQRGVRVSGKVKIIVMHREIGIDVYGQSKYFDHKDRDKLNNCRENIRPCTGSQNQANKARGRNNTLGYKGVAVIHGKRKTSFHAYIRVDKVNKNLGTFLNIEDAARAYDEAAKKYYGDFSCLNFPEKDVY